MSSTSPQQAPTHIAIACRHYSHFNNLRTIIHGLLRRGHKVTFIHGDDFEGKSAGEWKPSFDELQQYSDAGMLTDTHMELAGGDLQQLQMYARELLNYASYIRRSEQSDYYRERWIRYLAKPLRPYGNKGWFKALVANPVSQALLKLFLKLTPGDAAPRKHLKQLGIDVLVVSPMNFPNAKEIEYARAARRLHIPVVVPVLSWDNLTTKGLFHLIPDWTLIWNEFHARDAVTYHHIPRERMVYMGAPAMDKWMDHWPDPLTGRQGDRIEFLEQAGLNPAKPYVLYLGSSKGIAKDEGPFIQRIIDAMRNHPNKRVREMGVMIRPHPIYAMKNQSLPDGYHHLHGDNIAIWPDQRHILDDFKSNTYADFVWAVAHSAAVVCINTTAMLEAMMLGKPGFAIVTPEYAQTQRDCMHFQNLIEGEAIGCVDDFAAFADKLDTLLNHDEDERLQSRPRFIEAFTRPNGADINAGDFGAFAIDQVARRKPASLLGNREALVKAYRDEQAALAPEDRRPLLSVLPEDKPAPKKRASSRKARASDASVNDEEAPAETNVPAATH